MNDLLPCPFCGGEAELNISDFSSSVKCKECGVKSRCFIHGTDDLDGSDIKAIKAWNVRNKPLPKEDTSGQA